MGHCFIQFIIRRTYSLRNIHDVTQLGCHFGDTMHEVVSKRTILAWQKGEGGGLKNLQVFATSLWMFNSDDVLTKKKHENESLSEYWTIKKFS